MNYEIEWDNKALDKLSKLDLYTQKRILNKLDEFANMFSFNHVKRLKGNSDYRLRIGDYKIIFMIKNTTIFILNLGHRKNIYKK